MNRAVFHLLNTNLAAFALCASAFAVHAGGDEPRQVPQTRADVLLSFAPVAKKAQPSVVNVYASRTEKRARNPLFDDPIFRQFFGEGGNRGPVVRPPSRSGRA